MKGFAYGPSCRRCNEPVDESDDYCPVCGYPVTEPKPGKKKVRVQRER